MLAAGRAHAETPRDRPTAIEVDREDAPAGRTELGFDGGAPLAGWGLSLGAGVLAKPLTLAVGDQTLVPVVRRETLVFGGALALGGSVVIDLRIPLVRQTGTRVSGTGSALAIDGAATRYHAGDVRLAGRVRIAGDADRAVFLRGALTLPTGDDHDFAGDARWSLGWHLVGRATLPAGLIVAATAGVHIRGAEIAIGDRLVGDELTGALGVVAPVLPLAGLSSALTAELDGVLADTIHGVRGPSPLELRGGIVVQALPELGIGLRVGVGLDDQIGAPRYRAMLELAWRGDWNPLSASAPATTDDTLDE